MAPRKVLRFPDPGLRLRSRPVRVVTDAIRELADELATVMYHEPGIGLAAPQVGEPIRLIVVDTDWNEEGADRNPLVVVNPEISEAEGLLVWTEACLSVPDFSAEVERAERVLLRGHALDGSEIAEHAEGLRSVCFQHEVDHLDGVLFIDRISRLKRSLYVKKRKKQLREEQESTAGASGPSR